MCGARQYLEIKLPLDAPLRCFATARRAVEVIPTWLSAVASCSNMAKPSAAGAGSAPAAAATPPPMPASWDAAELERELEKEFESSVLHKAASTQDEEEKEGRIPDWGGWAKNEELRAKSHLEYTTLQHTTFKDKTPSESSSISISTDSEKHPRASTDRVVWRQKAELASQVSEDEYTTLQHTTFKDKTPSESSSISISSDSDKHPRASTDRVDWRQRAELASQVSEDGCKRCCTCKVPKPEEQLSLCASSSRMKCKGDVAEVYRCKDCNQFMDLEDSTEKFKDKPDQLANIKKHAKTLWDKTRGEKLYEVVAYKPLTGAQKKQLASMKTKFDRVKESLDDAIKSASEDAKIEPLFPRVVLQAASVELTGASHFSQRMAELIVGRAAVESVKDFKAGIMLTQKSLEKTVGKINDMMGTICAAAGIDA